MILKKLTLQNFRSYKKTEFDFSEKTNLIVGPNASGKTNILEAICFLATGKSIRVKGVEKEAIMYGEEIARITGEIIQLSNYSIENFKEDGSTLLDIVLTTGEVGGERTGKKKYLVNGVGKRQVDFLGNLRAVYFGPEDLELVTSSPSLRRKYLDMVLCQTDHDYARSTLSYEKGLRQRNKILEDFKKRMTGGQGAVDRRRLYFWDQLLIKNGNIVTTKREEFIEFLNSRGELEKVGEFSVEYDRSTISQERLARYADEELLAGMTLVGPHRDDFIFRIKNYELRIKDEGGGAGRDLAVYGSRGEQRLAILWLKLRELEFIKEKTEDLPLLLLDDIFSELDTEHRQHVFKVVGNQQTIITTADIEMVDRKLLEQVMIIEV